MTHVNQPIAGTGFEKLCEYVAGDCLPALALPWPSAGEDGKPQGGFQRRRDKAPVRPRQRVRIDQVVSRGAPSPVRAGAGHAIRPRTSAGMPWVRSSLRLTGCHR